MARNRLLVFIFCILSILFYAQAGHAQSVKKSHPKRSQFIHNIFKKVKSSITVSKKDSSLTATFINTKSVVPFVEHQGKIIRNISTKELGFEKVFTDTSKTINYYGTKLLNALHTDTYDWVIRDNLFIRKGSRLNPYLISDNERYLRSLEFIQDARILVLPVEGSPDSVDIQVVTKDLFSITGSLDFSGVDRQRIKVAETNLAGAGQKIQITALRDYKRQPVFGYEVLYSKNSLAHSFINGTVGYTTINSDRTGRDNVSSLYLQLERNLVSPYSKMAGGMQLRFNQSSNFYREPDSLFRGYKNISFDAWAGVNIGVKKLINNETHRNRTFLAFRYVRNEFSQVPHFFSKGFNSLFNNVNAALAEVTFFRQEFYKTNYIFGFGTTEDVPYGYNIALTGGWYKQVALSRPYLGLNANRYFATDKGTFMQYFVRGGAFLNKGNAQDASILLGGSVYSRLYLFEHFKMRQYLKYSYTRLFNGVTYDLLQINNPLGLRYFKADTLKGIQRMSLYAETFFFPKYKFFGFQLAPFFFTDATMLTGANRAFHKSDIYTGVGGGLRTRNVNLVFATAELRLMYFPRKAQHMNAFQVSFVSNIRFRYNTNYIHPPDVIQLNNDVNSFY